ncbi:MAG: radical SAM protein [Clostridia bacterium]|nr:radical SAM protein [Clostridia bacterium]
MDLSYKKCGLCERRCLVDRERGELGFCRMSDKPTVARAALHAWEEPIISGTRGSGTIFFSSCSLKCVFCQNRQISRGRVGKDVGAEALSDIMLRLQSEGAHNINFVTPTHFAPSIRKAIIAARKSGLTIPTVYNTSSYDTPETIRALSDTIDIYPADFKYYRAKTARELSAAENYPEAAKAAIDEMLRQRPEPIIENGLMSSGVIVRILLLPNRVAEAKLILKYLHGKYGDRIYVSLMNQYTPMPNMKPPLDRRVTHAEYSELVEYAERLGVERAFIQEWGTADESFIPDFSGNE